MPGVTAARRAREAPPRGRVLSIALAILAVVSAAVVATFFVAPGDSAATTPRWRALPRAPIAGRLAEAFVWTGRELVVAGGLTRRGDGTSRRVRDGAAYDPTAGRWRRIASPPAGVGAGAVWTGSVLATWTGNMPEGPAVGAVYDPRSNRWRRLPDGPLGVREGNADVWTGKELLVIGGYTGGGFATPIAAAVNPATGRWRTLRGLFGLTLHGAPNGAVWDGREAIVAGNLSLCPERGTACGRSRPILVAYDPTGDRMRELKLPASLGAATASSLTPLAWTGREVIFRASAPGSLRVLAYRPSTGRWRIGPLAACTLPHGADTQTVWIGDRLVAPCGAAGLQTYDPQRGAGQWRSLAAGASPLNSAAASATAWTGSRLIVWSGWTFRRFNPTPADGASVLLGR